MIRFLTVQNFGDSCGCNRLAVELYKPFLDSVTGASTVLLSASSFHSTHSRSLSSTITHRRWLALWPRCFAEYSLPTSYHTSVVRFNMVFTVAEYEASSELCSLIYLQINTILVIVSNFTSMHRSNLYKCPKTPLNIDSEVS